MGKQTGRMQTVMSAPQIFLDGKQITEKGRKLLCRHNSELLKNVRELKTKNFKLIIEETNRQASRRKIIAWYEIIRNFIFQWFDIEKDELIILQKGAEYLKRKINFLDTHPTKFIDENGEFVDTIYSCLNIEKYIKNKYIPNPEAKPMRTVWHETGTSIKTKRVIDKEFKSRQNKKVL